MTTNNKNNNEQNHKTRNRCNNRRKKKRPSFLFSFSLCSESRKKRQQKQSKTSHINDQNTIPYPLPFSQSPITPFKSPKTHFERPITPFKSSVPEAGSRPQSPCALRKAAPRSHQTSHSLWKPRKTIPVAPRGPKTRLRRSLPGLI